MKVIIGLVVGGILGYGAACMVHYGVPGMAANASMTDGTETLICTIDGHTSRYAEGAEGVLDVGIDNKGPYVNYKQGWPLETLRFANAPCRIETK